MNQLYNYLIDQVTSISTGRPKADISMEKVPGKEKVPGNGEASEAKVKTSTERKGA